VKIMYILSDIALGCTESFTQQSQLDIHFEVHHSGLIGCKVNLKTVLKPLANPFAHIPLHSLPSLPLQTSSQHVLHVIPNRSLKQKHFQTALSVLSSMLPVASTSLSIRSSPQKKIRLATKKSVVENEVAEEGVISRKLSDLPKMSHHEPIINIFTREIPEGKKGIQLSIPLMDNTKVDYHIIPPMSVTYATFALRYAELERTGLLDDSI
jgi:hypothetical protein